MGVMASQITSLTIVYSTVHSSADQRKLQSSASLPFVWGIHRWPVNSPHKWPVTRKMFPFDDVIMRHELCSSNVWHLPSLYYFTLLGWILAIYSKSKLVLKSLLMYVTAYHSKFSMMVSWHGNSFLISGLWCHRIWSSFPTLLLIFNEIRCYFVNHGHVWWLPILIFTCKLNRKHVSYIWESRNCEKVLLNWWSAQWSIEGNSCFIVNSNKLCSIYTYTSNLILNGYPSVMYFVTKYMLPYWEL